MTGGEGKPEKGDEDDGEDKDEYVDGKGDMVTTRNARSGEEGHDGVLLRKKNDFLFSVSWKLAQATHSTAPKTLQSRAIWLAASNERSSVLRSCATV